MSRSQSGKIMQRNNLNLIVGALVILVVALGGYIIYEQTRPKGVELNINENGVSLEQK